MRKMQINETENKKECYVPDTELASVIKTMARGCYQQMVASNLCENGFIVGYRATGSPLVGHARKYKVRYEISVNNFIARVNEILPENYLIIYDKVGKNGAYGYRMVRSCTKNFYLYYFMIDSYTKV